MRAASKRTCGSESVAWASVCALLPTPPARARVWTPQAGARNCRACHHKRRRAPGQPSRDSRAARPESGPGFPPSPLLDLARADLAPRNGPRDEEADRGRASRAALTAAGPVLLVQ